MQEELVTITMKEYGRLLEEVRFLDCLYDAGVDYWIGYDDARKLFEEDEGDEKTAL